MTKPTTTTTPRSHSQAAQRLGDGAFFNVADDDDDAAAAGCFSVLKRWCGGRRRRRRARRNATVRMSSSSLRHFERVGGDDIDDVALSDVSPSTPPASSSVTLTAARSLVCQLEVATASHAKHVAHYENLGAQALRERAANRPQQALITMRKRAAVKESIDLAAKMLDEISTAQLRLEQIENTNEHVNMQRMLAETTRAAMGGDEGHERLIQSIHDVFSDSDEIAQQVDRIQGTLASALNLADETRLGPVYDDDDLLRELAALDEATSTPSLSLPAPLPLPTPLSLPTPPIDVPRAVVAPSSRRAESLILETF